MQREKKRIDLKVEIKKEALRKLVKNLNKCKQRLQKEVQKFGNYKKNLINKTKMIQILKRIRLNKLMKKRRNKNKAIIKIVMILTIQKNQKDYMEWERTIIVIKRLYKMLIKDLIIGKKIPSNKSHLLRKVKNKLSLYLRIIRKSKKMSKNKNKNKLKRNKKMMMMIFLRKKRSK